MRRKLILLDLYLIACAAALLLSGDRFAWQPLPTLAIAGGAWLVTAAVLLMAWRVALARPAGRPARPARPVPRAETHPESAVLPPRPPNRPSPHVERPPQGWT